jgi:hypothetical protein
METNMFTHNRDDVHRLSTANVIFIIIKMVLPTLLVIC